MDTTCSVWGYSMEDLNLKVLEKPTISLLWPNDESYNLWMSDAVYTGRFVRDLSIDMVLNEIGFERAEREKIKLLFANLCTDEEVLQYRLDIMQDFLENDWILDNFKEFVKTMDFIRSCSKERFENVKGIHVQTYFFEKASAYTALITGIRDCLKERNVNIKSEGLKKLLDYVNRIAEENEFRTMTEEIKRITEEYENIPDVYLEISYYLGLKEISFNVEKSKKHTPFKEPLISQLLSNGEAFLDNNDKKYMNIYYDARFSRLEEIIFERLEAKKPVVLDSLRNFYNKYSEQDFEDICNLKTEAEFYIKFTELIKRIERLGLKFCKPVIAKDQENNTKIDGLYDLTLALQRIKDGKYELYKEVVCNDLRFDKDGEIFVLTGPNKGGKTTYIRSVGIAQILFQAGCFVPASRAQMSIVDAIHTHFPEEEALGIDKGRLGKEAERISIIINSSTSKSLVLLNETFSSTREVDGYYLGRDVLKILMKLKCKGIYVTHFSELADDIDALNEEVPDGSKLAGLVAGIEDIDNKGLVGDRTYKIKRMKSVGLGYSRDIVLKHGLSSEQIIELLKMRGYIPR